MDQKAKELCLAFIKISVYIRRIELKKRFESLAFELLENIALRDRDRIFQIISVLEQFTEFSKIIYEIESVNADILLNELNNLRLLVQKESNSQLPNEKGVLPDIESIFSSQTKLFEIQNKKNISLKKDTAKRKKEIGKKEKMDSEHQGNIVTNNQEKRLVDEEMPKEVEVPNTTQNSIDDPTMRQSAIAEKIRQSGENQVQLKDIIAAFPNVSERTLRYDLQRLCSQGIIERKGSNGPKSYYTARVI